jgi:lysosomal acid lipase/cholesteryl ester hydrolase
VRAQPTPPVYDVSAINVAVHLYWGDNDILADPTDVQFLIKNLPNLKGAPNCWPETWPHTCTGNNEMKDFNHLDFIWGLRAAGEVYTPIIQTINKGANA